MGKDWGLQVNRLLLSHYENVLQENLIIQFQNCQFHCYQPFERANSVYYLGLEFIVEYTNGNQGIMPESHNNRVQCMPSKENHLHNIFKLSVPACPGINFRSIPWNLTFHLQESLSARNMISTYSRRFKKTQWCVLSAQTWQYEVVIITTYKDSYGWANCVKKSDCYTD